MKKPIALVVGSALLALTSAACWFGWMGWDDEYQIDERTGYASGPYEAWQVIGCVLCLILVCVLANLVLPWWWVAPVMTVSFAVAWSWSAQREDESGLWAVGAIMVFLGLGAASTALSATTWAVLRSRRGARPPRPSRP